MLLLHSASDGTFSVLESLSCLLVLCRVFLIGEDSSLVDNLLLNILLFLLGEFTSSLATIGLVHGVGIIVLVVAILISGVEFLVSLTQILECSILAKTVLLVGLCYRSSSVFLNKSISKEMKSKSHTFFKEANLARLK